MFVTKLTAVFHDWSALICGTAYGCPTWCCRRRNAYRNSTETTPKASTERRYTGQVWSASASMPPSAVDARARPAGAAAELNVAREVVAERAVRRPRARRRASRGTAPRRAGRSSEPLREEQRDDEEDGERDREDEPDGIGRVHSFSAPFAHSASSANTASVTSTNTTSATTISSPCDAGCVVRQRSCAPAPAANGSSRVRSRPVPAIRTAGRADWCATEVSMARGTLRIYLGAAPGVGKTVAMLDEGGAAWPSAAPTWSSAFVETHGRAHTAQCLGRPAGRRRASRSSTAAREFEEMDLAAVLARRPAVALVDELAHTNVPGSGPHERRWQDVEDAARGRHRRHQHGQHPAPGVAQRRRRSRSPACRSARPCPTRSCAPPTRSSSST